MNAKHLGKLILGSIALCSVSSAAAQEFPSKPVRIIVSLAAGGVQDIVARTLGNKLTEQLGQPVIVDPRPGGSGVIAAEIAKNAPPDGYTLLLTGPTIFATLPALKPKLPYDPDKDFVALSRVANLAGSGSTIGVGRAIQSAPDGYTLSIGNWTSHVGASAVYRVPWNILTDQEPVAMLSTTTLIIVSRTGFPANDGKELIAWLKANPDQATAATVGAGSGAHICGIYFEQKTGTRFRYVPYRGGSPAIADLLGNQVDLFCGEASQMLPHFRAGRIKPLVVMSKLRWRPLPEIPTMEEVGASDTHIAF